MRVENFVERGGGGLEWCGGGLVAVVVVGAS